MEWSIGVESNFGMAKILNTCSTPRLHSIEYTVSCILWSGILDRSYGFVYSMEWSFGGEYWSGMESNFGVAKTI